MEWCRQVHFKICKYQKLKRVRCSEGYLLNWMYMKHFINKVFLNVAAAHGLKAASFCSERSTRVDAVGGRREKA